MPSGLLDLHLDRITPNNAEVLVWLENSLSKKNFYQQILHKVIEDENVKVRYLTLNRYQIEEGKHFRLDFSLLKWYLSK